MNANSLHDACVSADEQDTVKLPPWDAQAGGPPRRSTYLQARLRVRGQEGLARPRQEGLASREEGARGCRCRLAEVQEAHGAGRLQGGPHGPLAREHGLLSLLIKGGTRLREGQGTGRGHRVTAPEEGGRGGRRRRAALLQKEMTREPRLT